MYISLIMLMNDFMNYQVINLLVPVEPADDHDIVMEVSAGVGGQEAMLFTQEIFHMYLSYAQWKGWTVDILEESETELGK